MIAYSNENRKHITVSKTWMTFRSNIELKKPDTKKHNLYYFTLIKYKNEQNPSELLEARQVVTEESTRILYVGCSNSSLVVS